MTNTPNLEHLLACRLSGQMDDQQWVAWCVEHPELQVMMQRHVKESCGQHSRAALVKARGEQ